MKLAHKYEDIYLPKNTSLGVWIGIFSLIFGFAITWHIWWLTALSFIGILASLIIRLTAEHDPHFKVSAEEIKQIEREHIARQAHT